MQRARRESGDGKGGRRRFRPSRPRGKELARIWLLSMVKTHCCLSLRSQLDNSSLLLWPESLLFILIGTGPRIGLLTSPLFPWEHVGWMCAERSCWVCAAFPVWTVRSITHNLTVFLAGRTQKFFWNYSQSAVSPLMIFFLPWEKVDSTKAL